MTPEFIDRKSVRAIESYAQAHGLAGDDGAVEIFKPTIAQRVTAARKRGDLESVYDVYVVRQPGESAGALVNVLKDGDYGSYLNILSGVSSLIGITPMLGPAFQGFFGAMHAAIGTVGHWAGNKFQDGFGLSARSDAALRFASNQFALAAIGFTEDLVLSPWGSAAVRAVHNIPVAVANFKDAARCDKEGPSDFIVVPVIEAVALVSVDDDAIPVTAPKPIPIHWPRA